MDILNVDTHKCECSFCTHPPTNFKYTRYIDPNDLLNAISFLQKQFHRHHKLNGIATQMLNYFLKLTGSEYGYIAVRNLDTDGQVRELSILAASSTFTENSWSLPLCDSNSDSKFQYVYSHSFTTKNIVINNNWNNTADLSIKLNKVAVIPMLLKNKSLGQIFVGNPTKDYDMSLLCSLQPLIDTCIHIITGYKHYKTLKRVEYEAQKKSEFINISKMKDTFLSHISHEIRTPLNGIIGMSDLLSTTTELDETQEDYVGTIKQCSFQLLDLINDILDYSKMTAGYMELKPTDFNLNDCIISTYDTMSAQAYEKDIKLDYKIEDIVPIYFNGDVKRIRQILLNILSNAVKFTDKGFVFTKVSGNPLPDDMYELHFAIRDTGIGIAEKDVEKIFQSFKQVDSIKTRIYGGTGLGLPICSNLIRLMNGKIWVNSKVRLENDRIEESGSTFHVILRLKQATPSPNSSSYDEEEARELIKESTKKK